VLLKFKLLLLRNGPWPSFIDGADKLWKNLGLSLKAKHPLAFSRAGCRKDYFKVYGGVCRSLKFQDIAMNRYRNYGYYYYTYTSIRFLLCIS
jgi:hypothetical protein